jgi:pimeloyl-ACP methyl ester carboxylesterase
MWLKGALFSWLAVVISAEEIKPMGIGLEEVEYPYHVTLVTRTVQGQFVRMAYMAVNIEKQPTVVLLHGKNFFGAYWEETFKILLTNGYRVFVPDQIGFGKSAKPDIDYSFDLMAQHTVALLDAVGATNFSVVGHSMGGMLATHIAYKYPARVTHLILENPIGLEDYGKMIPADKKEEGFLYNQELQDTDPKKIREFFKKYVVQWKPEIYERFVEPRIRVTQSGEYPRWAKASAESYQMILSQPVLNEFPNVKAKTLLIIGQKDRTAVGKNLVSDEVAARMGNYPELGRRAAKAFPHARLVELPNVAHIPHLEAPMEFHRELLSFLKEP